jgi:glyoxylate reductase
MPPSSKKPLVFITRRLPDQIQARMMELFDTRLNESDTPLSHGALIEAVQSADVVVPTVTDSIDRKVIAAAGPQLKLIASFGTGVDHVDLAAAKERDILVTNTPGVLTEDTADMAMALLLAAPRRLPQMR